MKKTDLVRLKRDRMVFRSMLVLPDGRTFGAAMADFQREDFAGLDRPGIRYCYLERSRGASKTTDLACECVAELFLSPPGGRLFGAAVDRDQAALLHEAASGWIRRTPGLAEAVEVERWRLIVPSTDTIFTTLSADAPSSWGLSPTWVCCDELAMWPEGQGEALWQALWSSSGKRNARVICITTAGFDLASLCWRVREMARSEPSWYFSSRSETPPWISPEWIELQRRSLPEHVFKRLHQSVWTEGAGAFLLASEVDGIFTENPPENGGRRVIGLDLGLSRDATALAVVRRDAKTQVLVVDEIETWRSRAGERVDLTAVEEACAMFAEKFSASVYVDPWQAALLAQRLRNRGVAVKEMTFTAENRGRLFSTLLDLIRGGRLRARSNPEFRRELLGLEVTPSAGGFRVDHRRTGHDDIVVAVGLGTQALAQEAAFDAFEFETFGTTFVATPASPWYKSPARSQDYQDASEYW